MSSFDLDFHLNVAKQAAVLAGNFLVERFGNEIEAHTKSGDHLTIREDKMADDIYVQLLKKETPGIHIFSEEGEGSREVEYQWVVDPIDGTTNFMSGREQWVTQIALVRDSTPIIGIVYDPLRKYMYWAAEGRGTYKNEKKISVSHIDELKKSVVAIEKGHGYSPKIFADEIERIYTHCRSVRNLGTAGYTLAMTAEGAFDMHYGLEDEFYDYAPGAVLVREAGGECVFITGKMGDKSTVVFGNKHLAKELADVLKKV